jgi:hypothetical protein
MYTLAMMLVLNISTITNHPHRYAKKARSGVFLLKRDRGTGFEILGHEIFRLLQKKRYICKT